MKRIRGIYIVAALLFCSCTGQQADPIVAPTPVAAPLKETASPAIEAANGKLITTGKLVATRQAELFFQTNGIISRIYVKNGQRVAKGQKLAELDKFALSNKSTQAKDALERAKLELQDVLIGQGYRTGEMGKVPADVMKLARVKSGYDQQQALYELACHEEEQATLIAPFDGIIANMYTAPLTTTESSKAFCLLVGTTGMEADFYVPESELAKLAIGDKLTIIPYADSRQSYEGTLTQINPLVDEKGMIRMRATIPGKERLFSGMSVRIEKE